MNICSNQIKEVILHRFKVNSLQKLLIHINFLLAFIVLFCSRSAYGQSEPSVTFYAADIDTMAVDLGFTKVYWSKRNFAAELGDETSVGGYYDHSGNLPSQYSSNSNWRVPTKDEVDTLTDLNKVTIVNNNGFKIISKKNSNEIFIPLSGYKIIKNGKIWGKSAAYFWTSTPSTAGMHYTFKGEGNDVRSYSSSSVVYKAPFRPVINKCQITVKIFEDETQINEFVEYVPIGTHISLEANPNSCYKVHWEIENSDELDSYNYTISWPIEQSVTFIAVFTIKTTNLEATTEDNRKGSVGLKVGDEIE